MSSDKGRGGWLPWVLGAVALISIFPVSRARAQGAEIDFWAVGANTDDVFMYRRVLEAFKKETGIGVRITPLGWGDFDTKYFAAMAAQLPPDVGITNLGGPMHYGSVGGLVDLLEEFPSEIQELKDRFYPAILPQFYFRGKLFGLPTDVGTMFLYYRKDIFAKLGLKPPTTWNELDAAIRTIESQGMRFYYGWTKGEQWSVYYHTMPYGFPGVWKVRHPDGREEPRLDWNEPLYQKGILHAMDLWHLHENIGEGMGERGIGRFLTDDLSLAVPIVVDGNWIYQQISALFPEQASKWDILPWPRADEGVSVNVIGGTAYSIFSKSQHKREAFRFLQYLNSLPVQQAMLLDRMSRGKTSIFSISPIKALWAPENAGFFQKPPFDKSPRLIEVATQVVQTFQTTEVVLGKDETDRIESKIFDRVGNYIVDEVTALARSHDLNRLQLVQAFASGKYQDEKQKLMDKIAGRLKAEYAANTPAGKQALQREIDYYQERFADIIAELKTYENKADILTCLEWGAALFLLCLAGLILGRKKLRVNVNSYVFIAMPVALSLIFVFIPAIAAFYLSFTEYHPVLPLSSAKAVGIKQYLDVLTSGELLSCIGRTAFYVAITVPVGVLISLGLAALLNNNLKGSRIWRFLYFSPFVTSTVSVSLIFSQLYNGSELGWLNALFLRLGMIRDPLLFLSKEGSFLPCVMALAIWHGLAFNILIFLAALQQVPNELYRASEVDGAGWFGKFWHISLPGIRPQILFITIMGVIGGFQVFEQIYMLGGGSGYAGAKFGPNDAGLTMVPYIYNAGFEKFRMGLASAIAYILFAIIFVFTLIQLRMTSESASGRRARRRFSAARREKGLVRAIFGRRGEATAGVDQGLNCKLQGHGPVGDA